MMRVLVLALAALVLPGCKPEKPEMRVYRIGEQGLAEGQERSGQWRETVVAFIGGREVTAGEVEQALLQLPAYQRYYYSSPEKIKMFLQNLGVLDVLAAEGERLGLATRREVLAVLEERLAQEYKTAYLADAVKPSDIPEEVGAAARAALLEARRATEWEREVAQVRAELGLAPRPADHR